MFIVLMSMETLHRFVSMLVIMSLGEVQPDAETHQRPATSSWVCFATPLPT